MPGEPATRGPNSDRGRCLRPWCAELVQTRADHVAMVQRAVAPAEPGSRANRFDHVVLGALHGVTQGEAVRDATGNRRSQRAARAVSRFGVDAWVLEAGALTVGGAQ